jgi:hypothetical protein
MRKCEYCKKDINKGHVLFENEFYLCENCFNKFYPNEVAEIMYNDGLQYYTEWEEDYALKNRDYIKLLKDIVANLENEIEVLENYDSAYENNLEVLDFVDTIVNAFREEEKSV